MKLVFMALVLLSQIAQASDSVKITSFYFLQNGTNPNPAAELCGVLTAPTGKPELVKVTVDGNSKNPATYNTWAGKDGKFCLVLATYAGKADAELVQ